MINPLDPLSWLNALFGWFANSWTTSAANNFASSIELLQKAPWPDLSNDGFMLIWNSLFGASLLIGIFSIIVHSAFFMFVYAHRGIAGAFVNFFKLFLNGTFLLLLLVGAMALVDFLIEIVTTFVKTVTGQPNWLDPLKIVSGLQVDDIWRSLGLSYIDMNVGHILFAEASLMQFAIYFFAVWYLLGSTLGHGIIAQLVRSLIAAALFTAVFARLFQIVHLALSSTLVSMLTALGMNNITLSYVIMVAGVGSILLPAVVFLLASIAVWRVERKLDVRVIMKKSEENKTDALTPQQLAEERAQKVEDRKEQATNVVRAASISAATYAIAKTTSVITKKLTTVANVTATAGGVAPVPHAKVVALVAAGVSLASRAAERKSAEYLSRKIARPGSTRARSRTN